MSLQKRYKKLFSFLKAYYIIFSVLCILLLIGIIAGYKIFLQKPTYIYTKIKVGQPIWWAVSTKPSIWYMNAMNKGDISYDFLGRSEAEILDKNVYLWSGTEEYDIYLTVKMKVNKNNPYEPFIFNRSVISVGSPIEIQFLKENIKGTIIAVSDHFFKDRFIEKFVYLEKRDAYPSEYAAINIGDFVTDGDQTVFSILNKDITETTNFTSNSYGNSNINTVENRGYITIKAKVKLKQIANKYVLGEEKIVEAGRILDLSLGNYVLKDFFVSKIE